MITERNQPSTSASSASSVFALDVFTCEAGRRRWVTINASSFNLRARSVLLVTALDCKFWNSFLFIDIGEGLLLVLAIIRTAPLASAKCFHRTLVDLVSLVILVRISVWFSLLSPSKSSIGVKVRLFRIVIIIWMVVRLSSLAPSVRSLIYFYFLLIFLFVLVVRLTFGLPSLAPAECLTGYMIVLHSIMIVVRLIIRLSSLASSIRPLNYFFTIVLFVFIIRLSFWLPSFAPPESLPIIVSLGVIFWLSIKLPSLTPPVRLLRGFIVLSLLFIIFRLNLSLFKTFLLATARLPIPFLLINSCFGLDLFLLSVSLTSPIRNFHTILIGCLRTRN